MNGFFRAILIVVYGVTAPRQSSLRSYVNDRRLGGGGAWKYHPNNWNIEDQREQLGNG